MSPGEPVDADPVLRAGLLGMVETAIREARSKYAPLPPRYMAFVAACLAARPDGVTTPLLDAATSAAQLNYRPPMTLARRDDCGEAAGQEPKNHAAHVRSGRG